METDADAAKSLTFPVRRRKVFFGIPYGQVDEVATQEPAEQPPLRLPMIRGKRFLGMTYGKHSR